MFVFRDLGKDEFHRMLGHTQELHIIKALCLKDKILIVSFFFGTHIYTVIMYKYILRLIYISI